VTVADDVDGDQAVKTLTHETAHMVAGHTLHDNSRDVETVAESAAYVVLQHYSIDSSGYSFPYVSRWAQDRAVLKRNLEAIQQVSHEIIEGEDVVEDKPAHAPRSEVGVKQQQG
jgi:hypothetical protein